MVFVRQAQEGCHIIPETWNRGSEAVSGSMHHVASDSGNEKAAAIAARDDVGNFGAVAEVRPSKRKLVANDDASVSGQRFYQQRWGGSKNAVQQAQAG